jgi:wyosine [tRNA(Phe)-imidazoG37] synthetase (radical SAM superfamily)
MIDINFYQKFNELNVGLSKKKNIKKEWLFDKLEELRSKKPIIYNIETTNACNMRCKMCPRTTMMTRKIETITKDLFIKIVEQIKPHTKNDWMKWEEFAQRRYGIAPDGMSENHFFLYIIPKVIQLHGYGDPLLDKNIAEEVKMLKQKGFYSYFSCNPANIDIKKSVEILANGLDYIKYSIESVDDAKHKQIRGQASNFTESYKKILQLLDLKAKKKFETTIIITMIDLHREDQLDEFRKLKEAFRGLDVYIYFKSEDTQWYRKDYHGTKSIHWSELCKHPWMSMTIKSNGEAAMCMEDYNNEIILGDTKTETLYDIWNGEKYRKFRADHINLTPGIKCSKQCDMTLIGSLINEAQRQEK